MSPAAPSPGIEDLIASITFVPPEAAKDYLHAAIRRRLTSLHAISPTTANAEQLIAEIESDQIIAIVGTAQPALEIIAACIVELGTTTRAIASEIRRLDILPVAAQPALGYLGIDIAYIIAFRALTREQRWLLHTLAVWAPAPATIARDYALVVGQGSGRYSHLLVTADDLARLVALGFVTPEIIEQPIITTSTIPGRLHLEPYIRYIAAQGLAEWPIPEADPSVTAEIVLASMFVHWAVSFAEIVAGPDMTPAEDIAAETADDEDADPEATGAQPPVAAASEHLLTPDPDLAALTDDEAWAALAPETPHVLVAAQLARELGAADYVYRLNQLLSPRLRSQSSPAARTFRRMLLEEGLLCARAAGALRETLLLATQLTDVALDDQQIERAALFAAEALAAAVSSNDLQAVAFTARRQAALAIRRGDRSQAIASARQAIATARALHDAAGLREGVHILETATRMA